MPTSLPVHSPARTRTVVLAGNPNSGKSTVFNALTGFRQRVGNYPGVTVERREGFMRDAVGGTSIELVDLPGAYSLAANAADESIVLDALLGRHDKHPDLIVSVVDAANLGRNLFFTTQVLELGVPVIVALNMLDLAEASGLEVDAEALARDLGVPVVPIVASKGVGIDALRQAIVDAAGAPAQHHCPAFPECVCAELDGLCSSLAAGHDNGRIGSARAEAMQTLLNPGGYHESQMVNRCGLGLAGELAERRRRIASAGESLVEVEARVRYAWIDRVVQQVVRRVRPQPTSRTEIADRILTHRLVGLLVFIVVMAGCFQSIYAWAQPVMDATDAGFSFLAGWISEVLPPGPIQSLIANGVIAGVGAVLVFLPQILVLFFFLAILEDCGYMARAAFLLDRLMGLLGLNGKSFIPLLSSFACAVPGIMATRTIEDRRDRLVTILIAPLMSCSARLPVYVLFIGAFVPATPLLGGALNLQAATLFGMYTIGAAVAIPIALLLKRTVLKGPPQSFLMELPTYKWPSPRTVFFRVFEQGKAFCVSAGTLIFAVTIVIWALGYYPHPSSIAADHDAQRLAARAAHEDVVRRIAETVDPLVSAEQLAARPAVAAVLAELQQLDDDFARDAADKRVRPNSDGWLAAQREADAKRFTVAAECGDDGAIALQLYALNTSLRDRLADLDRHESGAFLGQSVLGRTGKFIEPLVKPLGWDWRIGTAVIAAFPAREVIIATMGTIYNLGGHEDETSSGLRERLHAAVWPDGHHVFNLAVAMSIMVFFALCCQCGGTLATIRRETRSWRWPIFTFSYMTAIAYLAALLTYQFLVRFA
ncbi:MAG: ferrous iron transport protein B [Planctomycetota bacterium]